VDSPGSFAKALPLHNCGEIPEMTQFHVIAISYQYD
jgi:hypothetical protein